MSFLESLRLAFDSIWSAKLRSFFTLLGIIVSVAFLVVVVAVIQGMVDAAAPAPRASATGLAHTRRRPGR